MSDLENSEFPIINAGMFRQPGGLSLTRAQQVSAHGKSFLTWCHTVDFYCERNKMTTIILRDEDGGMHIKWYKENN